MGSCGNGMERIIKEFNLDKQNGRLTESQDGETLVAEQSIKKVAQLYTNRIQQAGVCDYTCGFSKTSKNCGMQPKKYSEKGKFLPIDMGEAHCTELKAQCANRLEKMGDTEDAAKTKCNKCYMPQDCRIGGALCGRTPSASAAGNDDNEALCDAHYIVRSVVAQCGYKCQDKNGKYIMKTGPDRFVCPPPNCRANPITGQTETCETSSLYQNPVALMFVIMGSALVIIAVECGIVAFGKAIAGFMCASDENAKP